LYLSYVAIGVPDSLGRKTLDNKGFGPQGHEASWRFCHNRAHMWRSCCKLAE